ISILKGGSSNLNHKVTLGKKSFFIKHQTVPPASRFYSNNLEREYTACKYLSRPTYSLAPTPYLLDTRKRFLVTEFIDGYHPTLKDLNIGTILQRIGRSLQTFHTFPIDYLQILNTDTRTCPRDFFRKIISPSVYQLARKSLIDGSSMFFQFLGEIETVLKRRLDNEPSQDCIIAWDAVEKNHADSPYQLLHNDLAFRNIIVRQGTGRICYIDFEFADAGDIAYDLAYFASENQLLGPQISTILSNMILSPRIIDRTRRYIRIFLPLLELANAYWTLTLVSKIASGDRDILSFQLPHTIGQNMEYVRWKIRRLAQLLPHRGFDEDKIFYEVQGALKLFEAQVSISGGD
ncbi:MAG TPA: aminoglycoside phosphotransferase family protein, partial [Candidatus Hodarchaeales archaeon]|nr:aminoglycoside phosphotransferase family protein [Candidatus Hodarchaeales archaeon]